MDVTINGLRNSFNPRTSCEVRREYDRAWSRAAEVSIHAPRVRCDTSNRPFSSGHSSFNPRTSCEVRPQPPVSGQLTVQFQSTHLV